MGPILRSGEYWLDLDDLYSRMWAIAGADRPDGTRLYAPRSDGSQALKWLIHDLAGTPTHRRRTMPDNNTLRQLAHEALEAQGWAQRLTNTSFLLLRAPGDASTELPASPAGTGADGEAGEPGTPIDDVALADVVDEDDRLTLLDVEWSPWRTLTDASQSATTEPGVYVAASAGEIVYVGMAGARRGKGVRDRLRIYARGRGAVSGLGEAALDRALADPAWLAERLSKLHATGPQRAQAWAQAALERADLRICWSSAPDEETARRWEREALTTLEDMALWNRDRPRREAGDWRSDG